MISVSIAGVDRTRLIDPSSLRITQVITSQADSCMFTVKKFGARTYIPSAGDEVIITQDGSTAFAGVITEINEIYETHNYVGYTVQCSDYTYLMDARLVVEVFENQTVLEIIEYLKENYLPPAITINSVDVDTMVKYAAFNYEPVSHVLAQLAELVGADWYIDYAKDIHFNLQNATAAPFNLADTTGKYIYESLIIRRDQTQVRTVIFVRGGEYLGNTLTAAFDGNGSQRYFYLPYKMSDVTLTVTGQQKSLGVDPLDDPSEFDAMHNFQEKVIFFRSDRAPRDTSALAASQKVRIGGMPYLPVIVKMRDKQAVDAFTAREYAVVDERIKSKEGARQRALSELLAYKTTIAEAQFDTYEAGLHTGQQINVQSTIRGIDADYVINKLEWTVFAFDMSDKSTVLKCRASLVTTRTFGFTQLLQRLINQEKKSLVIDEDEVLDLVEAMQEDMAIGEAFTAHRDYGQTFVAGPWTGGFPKDTGATKKRLFILDGSRLA